MKSQLLPAARDVSRATSEDAELAHVLDAYLAAVEAGEPMDAEGLIAAHPAIAERLRACLASLRLVEQTAMRLSAVGAPEEPSGSDVGQLGDFCIRREVGRGGMGVVYEAEQISLGRRVALKVLPFAATMDPRQLQRFKNEAHAAAQLHHTNIVPVFAVGCERGVHFYAMQFIEGHSLADVIARLRASGGRQGPTERHPDATTAYQGNDAFRSPAADTPPIAALSSVRSADDAAYFRTVTQFAIQAAEALDYAHQQGIVHRDVKPANLMLDAAGRLWVTDFGLAQIQSDTRLTMTGDLVGTLRYMSPEQALAKRVVVDHRTDVYSLGATLYELLTLEPVFRGADRQELLRQIAFEEPLPPRRMNRAVPTELETVVLKALEKNPTDRYATAQELADDLRRYLGHEPIRARRPSLGQRLRKWGLRHRSIVASAVVCLFIIAVVLAISTLVIWQKQRDSDAAYHAADEQREEADRQRQEAIETLKDAHAAVDQLSRVGIKGLAGIPYMEPLRREMVTDALGFYKKLIQRENAGPELRLQTARASMNAGIIQLMLGDPREAEKVTRQGIALAEEALREAPAAREWRHMLAQGWIGLGRVHLSANQMAEAEKALRAGHEILVVLTAEYAEAVPYRKHLAQANADLATVYARTGRPASAEGPYREAIRLGEQLVQATPDDLQCQLTLATIEGNLGNLLSQLGRREEAEKLIMQALERQEKVVAKDTSPKYRACLANLYRDLGLRQRQWGQFKEAFATHQKAVDLWSVLQRDFPHVPDYSHSYARVLLFAGQELMALGRDPAALDYLSTAEGLYTGLANQFPKKKDYGRELAWTCADRAWLLAASNNARVRKPADAIAPAKKAIEQEPQDSKHWAVLGMAYYRSEQWQAALAPLIKAGKRPRAERIDLYLLAMTHWKLGNKDDARKWYGQAETWRLQHAPNGPELPGLDREAAALLGTEKPQS